MALRSFGELSIAEIAEAMKCPEGTVNSLLARAKATLRRELGE